MSKCFKMQDKSRGAETCHFHRPKFQFNLELKQTQIWISELWVRNQEWVVLLLQRYKAKQFKIRLKPVKHNWSQVLQQNITQTSET